MARMIPSTPGSETPFSERTVFEVFEKALPSDWTVVHGRRVFIPKDGNLRKFEGEADFLVLDPGRGLLVLEVKGGEVGRDRDGWYTIPYGSSERVPIKDPGWQAQQLAHRLSEFLKRSRRFGSVHRGLPYGHGVVLPATTVERDLDPALPRSLVVDERDLADCRRSLTRVYDANGMGERGLPSGLTSAFVDAVAPVVALTPGLSHRFSREARELVRLTEEQISILDGLDEQRRVGVKGVAGSGKTMLAMEKARRLSEGDRRVLFLCYNEPLAEYLATRAQGFEVMTFHRLCSEMAQAVGLSFRPPADAEASRRFFEEVAPQMLMDALKAFPDERFDAVVIDEGQDFREYWWPAIEELLVDEESILYVFWDPNQDLYGGGPNTALALAPFSLTFNCRNTERIAQHACTYIDVTAKIRPGAPTGVEVEEFRVGSDREMVERVRKLLHKFVVEEKLDPVRVVILTANAVERSPVWAAGKLGNLELVRFDASAGPNQIRFGTIRRFKGLESDVVILCDVTDGPPSGPTVLHVGASRARHALAVVRRG